MITKRLQDPYIPGAYYFKKSGTKSNLWYMYDPDFKKVRLLVGVKKNGNTPKVCEHTRGGAIELFTDEKNDIIYKMLTTGTQVPVQYPKLVLPDGVGNTTDIVLSEKASRKETMGLTEVRAWEAMEAEMEKALIGDNTGEKSVVPDGNKKEETKEEKKEVVEHVAEVKMPDGTQAEIRGDGKVWQIVNVCGAKVRIPMEEGALRQKLIGDNKWMEVESEFKQMPDIKWKIGDAVLQDWAARLLEFNTEALCIYGKREEGKEITEENPLWLAVVPKQEVTGGSVDVDDFSASMQLLIGRGYRKIGTIHTHPGGGTPHYSSTDANELWKGFGGIHLIVSRDGGVSTYFATGTEVWDMGEMDEKWKYGRLWENDGGEENGKWHWGKDDIVSLVAESGTIGLGEIQRFVQEKVWKNTYCGGSGQKKSWWEKEKNGELFWNPTTRIWRIWDDNAREMRDATRSEVAKAGGYWETGWMDKMERTEKKGKKDKIPSGDCTVITISDSIQEVVEALGTWPLAKERKAELRRLETETKMMLGAYERYVSQVLKIEDQWEKGEGVRWVGTVAIQQIIYRLSYVEDELYGKQTETEI
jgi:hypothetical protein